MKKTILIAAVLFPALPLIGQRMTTVAVEATALAPSTEGDKVLATWLQVACANEVSLAEMALKQGGTEVRAFAQTVIDGHTAFAAKLQPHGSAKCDPADQASPKDAATKKSATTGEAAIVKPFDHAALIQDLGKRCLQSQSAILVAKTGAEFDRLYMPMQVAGTVRELDMIVVFQNHASAPLSTVLADEQSALTKLCEQATRLCQQVCEPMSKGDAHQPPVKKAP